MIYINSDSRKQGEVDRSTYSRIIYIYLERERERRGKERGRGRRRVKKEREIVRGGETKLINQGNRN